MLENNLFPSHTLLNKLRETVGKGKREQGSAVKEAQKKKEFTLTFDQWVQCCGFPSALRECSGYCYGKAVCLGNVQIQWNYLLLLEWLVTAFGL